MRIFLIAIFDQYECENRIFKIKDAIDKRDALEKALLKLKPQDPDFKGWVLHDLKNLEFCEMVREAINSELIISDCIEI